MITSYELVCIATEYVTADLLIWKRYRQKAPGMVEALLDANPQLSYVHKVTPFIPVGVFVRIPIDNDKLLGIPPVLAENELWTDKYGYRL